MRNNDQRAIMESFTDAVLYENIGLFIYARGRLVHDHDLLAGEQRAGEAEELALALREVFAAWGDGGGEGDDCGRWVRWSEEEMIPLGLRVGS